MQDLVYRITASGIKSMKKRIKELEDKKYKIDDQIQHNLIEDSNEEEVEHQELMRELFFIDEEIKKLQTIIDNAIVIKKNNTDKAEPGSTVKLSNHLICHIFRLVEPIEANPRQGKISMNSPLGQSILGRKIADLVTVVTPLGKTEYKIMGIN